MDASEPPQEQRQRHVHAPGTTMSDEPTGNLEHRRLGLQWHVAGLGVRSRCSKVVRMRYAWTLPVPRLAWDPSPRLRPASWQWQSTLRLPTLPGQVSHNSACIRPAGWQPERRRNAARQPHLILLKLRVGTCCRHRDEPASGTVRRPTAGDLPVQCRMKIHRAWPAKPFDLSRRSDDQCGRGSSMLKSARWLHRHTPGAGRS
jgi:hypothetical protein